VNPADAGSAAHVFVDDLDRPVLADGDRHHLHRVLRLRAGATVTVADGSGRWRLCRLDDALVTTGPIEVAPTLEPAITIGLALIKGERPELAVQKLTELGVDRFVLFPAARSVVSWDHPRVTRNRERLAAVARAAAMQSRRPTLPAVEVAESFDVVRALRNVAMAARDGAPPSLDRPAVLVGPEGGWDAAELDAGLPRVALGPAVLRAETAAITAAVLLTALRSQLVGPSPGHRHGP
jgi:16S rRNA (uracil1498-N3)-methyltransferase